MAVLCKYRSRAASCAQTSTHPPHHRAARAGRANELAGAEATRLQAVGFGRGSSAGRTVAHPEPQIGAESAEVCAICHERGLILGRTPGDAHMPRGTTGGVPPPVLARVRLILLQHA